jgi:hypothetical protein
LQRLGVSREHGLQLAVGAECDRDGRARNERGGDAPHGLRMRPQCARRPLAREGDGEHRHRSADRVGERQQHTVEPDLAPRRDHRHRGEHRAGAGDEDEPEARAEEEAAAAVAT